jgi:hypothetical protein
VEATAILDRIEGGGLYPGEPGLLGIRGTSWTQASWRLGDFDVTDPDRTGTPLLLADTEGLDAIEVSALLMPAEHGGAGPVIMLAPRRPGSSWHGVLQGSVVPTGLQQGTQSGRAPRIARYDSFGSADFRVDGPLVRDRLGLLLAVTGARAHRLERADPRPLLGRETGVLTRLHWTPTLRDEVGLLGAVQAADHPYAGRARFGGGDVAQADRFFQVQSTWRRSGTTPWSVSGGYARGEFEPRLEGRTSTYVVERLHDGPVTQLFPGASTRWRAGLDGRVEPRVSDRHAVRVGFSVARTSSSTRPAGPHGLTPESVDGLAARVWDYGWAGPESRWRAFDWAAYAADRITYGRLSLDAGLRFESTDASAAAGGGEIHWRALCPRLSAQVRLTEGGGLVFFTGWARYRHQLPLNLLAFGDPTAAQGSVYRWLDDNGDGVFDPGEAGPLVAVVGPGGPSASLDPGLKPPHSHEVVVGFEGRLGSTWTIRGLGYHRREDDLVASYDVGAPPSAYDLRFVTDPNEDLHHPDDDQLLPIFDRRPGSFGADRHLLSGAAGNAVIEGMELSIQGELWKRLRLLIGGTASRSDGPAANRGFLASENDHGLVGERLETPNATTNSRGRLFFERGYTLKVAAAYRAPHDVRVGIVARYQDGQHFSRLVIPTDLSQGPESVNAFANGLERFTYLLTVDVRLEKGFTFGRTRAAAVLEAFNLRGTALGVEEDVRTGPSYRNNTAVQPPRAYRFGMRLDF